MKLIMRNKGLIGWFLAVCVLLSSAACDSSRDTAETSEKQGNKQTKEVIETIASKPYGDVNSIEFWTAPNTEKIMSDQYAIYSDIKGGNEIDIKAVKNEYENAQLIMTAGEDVGGYTVTVSDLMAPGGAKIDKSNVTVYNQKYINITRITTQTSVPVGMYPDGLLETSLAAKAGENRIDKGKNQGLWVSVYVPKDIAAGTYTGELTVTLGSGTHKTPITVRVFDYILADEMHQKSSFSITWPYESGELDSTWECYAAYRDVLLDYRLSTEFFRHPATQTSEDYFVEESCKYARNPKKPQIILPYRSGSEGFDKQFEKNYVLRFVERSVVDNYNYCEQLMIYFGMFIDEPNPIDSDKVAQVKLIADSWNSLREEIATELEANAEFMRSDIATEVVASVRKMPHVLVGSRNVDAFRDVEAVWCPTIDYYYASKSLYDTQEERWWYTMLVPKPPYPTYHIEDGLMSGRVMSWMQYEYGVVGNLYWAVNDYLDSKGSPYGVEDYYDLFMDGGAANGDGWLFYPGAKYGLTGPIPTIRLESIRDGLEEYELLYDMGERYKDISAALGTTYTFNKIINNYAQYLYSGVKVLTSAEIFEGARNALLDYCALAKDDSAFLLDYSTNNADSTFTVMAKKGISVMKSGSPASVTKTVTFKGSEYSIYEIHVTDNTTQKVQVTVGDYTATLNFAFVGKSYSYEHSVIPSTSVSGSGINVSDGAYGAKSVYTIGLPNMAEDKTQAFTFNMRDVLDKVGKTANKLSFNIYTDEAIKLSVRFKYKNKPIQYEVYAGNLSVGGNIISISNLYSFDWASLGGIEYVTFAFGEKGDSARTVYLGDIVLTTVNF